MKIYYKQEQFPKVDQRCRPNPRGILHHDIEFIAAEENRIVVAENDADQEDFDVFWDEIDNFISYMADVLVKEASPYTISYLEEYSPDEVEERLLLREFVIEGVDWLSGKQF